MKLEPVSPADLVVECRACGNALPLEAYRLFRVSDPVMYMDFCRDCEQEHGTITLYRRYNAYGTKEIIEAVFAAVRVPPARRTPEQVRLLVERKAVEAPATNDELVRREFARREMARRRLLYFTTAMMQDYKAGWVHQDICRRLERFVQQVEAGRSPRLMLFVPPRHGKSQLASDMFPSWVFGHHPEWSIIAASYAQSLPVGFSRNIRDRLRDPEYQALFPKTKLRPDSQGVEEWKTLSGGGYTAAGVGTGVTGKGMHIGILDDPIKDAEAAASEVIREAAISWYNAVFRTRLAPGGGILIIQTRWHYADVSGKLLDAEEALIKAGVPEEERENWEVISYPAIADADEYLMRDGTVQADPADKDEALRLLRRRGEALHPERYPVNELIKIRNGFPSSVWNALYQQKPTPDEGDFFTRDDFRYRWLDPAYRPLCRTFMTVDYAIGKKERNDFTVMGVFAIDAEDNLYCLELRRGRWKTQEIVENIVALVERHKPEIYAGERGAIHEAVWPVAQAALDAKRLYVSVDETLVPIQDKETRARPLQGRIQRHKFFFSYDSATRPDVYDQAEKEMLQFPNGTHDDIVDCLAWAGRLSLNISLPSMKAPPKLPSWKDRLARAARVDPSFMSA